MDWNGIARIIGQAKKIIVFTGAGISTNSGIPDFRGENGLYQSVQSRYGLPCGEAIFDINYFDRDPLPFFDLSKELIGTEVRPTLCHRFISVLEEMGKVDLVITQNIDRLHQLAGSRRILECHGSYERGRCRRCGGKYAYEEYAGALEAGRVPRCSCGGVVKPDVVFFGEALPGEFYRMWENPPRADLILILGTSLSVMPAAGLALRIASRTRSVLVNRDRTDYDSSMDRVLHADLDEFAAETGERLLPEGRL